jgi:LacI family transcriptional regulator
MRQVADELGISLSTVSLALRGKTVIASETRERVLREAKRLGYVYNRSAANLRQRRRTLVGLVVPDITNPFVGEAALGLQSALAEQGQFAVLANTRDEVSVQGDVIASLIEERAAGIVLIPAMGTESEDLALIHESNTPAVLMNRDVPGSGLPLVGTEDAEIVRVAMDHLSQVHGIKEAAYFGGIGEAGPHVVRKEAFDGELARRQIKDVEAWDTVTGPNPAAAYEAASSLLKTEGLPEAILCHSDSIAIGLIRALDEARIPADRCAIVAIDGIAASAMTTPPLTTVAVDPAHMGRDCGRLLRPSGPAERFSLPPRLIVRRSCGCGGRA